MIDSGTINSATLTPKLLRKANAYWRAENYLAAGQFYLFANPLLKTPVTIELVKPRRLDHWRTIPNFNFMSVHWNRIINQHDLPCRNRPYDHSLMRQ